MGSRDLFNGVKILALSSAQLQIKEFKIFFLKFLNLIFSKTKKSLFVNFSYIVQGSIVCRLANFQENRCSGKKLRKVQKKFFDIYFGGPRSQGV